MKDQTWFPILAVTVEKENIRTFNNQQELSEVPGTWKFYETKFKPTEVEFGNLNVFISNDGYIYAEEKDREHSFLVDIREDFALMMLTNILSINHVKTILEKGWGLLGQTKENKGSNIGFFGPIY